VTQSTLADGQFEAQRGRLFSIAYRILGSATDAEDAVQDAYLRWRTAADVRDAEAYLVRVVTRLAVDRLHSARARREAYVGPWLPEPVLTGPGTAEPLDTVEQRESVSFAFCCYWNGSARPSEPSSCCGGYSTTGMPNWPGCSTSPRITVGSCTAGPAPTWPRSVGGSGPAGRLMRT
jgi:Sigma-70 region 2